MNKIRSVPVYDSDIERSYDSLKQDIIEKLIHTNYKFFYENIIDKCQISARSSQSEEILYEDAHIISYQPLLGHEYSFPLFESNSKIIVTGDTSKISYNWFRSKIVAVADYSEVVPGNYTAVEQVISDTFLLEKRETVLQWINQLFLDESKSKAVIANLLFAVSHMEYEDACPVGPTVAMLALNNSNRTLVELAIHAFENWNSKDSIAYLKSYCPDDKLNRRDWDRVIKYLEESGE